MQTELKRVICTDNRWEITTRLLNDVAELQQMPLWQLLVTRKNVLTCVSSQHQWFLYTSPDLAVQALVPSHLLSQLFHTLQHCVETKNVIGNCCFRKNLMHSTLKSWLTNLEMGLCNHLCSLWVMSCLKLSPIRCELKMIVTKTVTKNSLDGQRCVLGYGLNPVCEEGMLGF